MTIPPAAGDGEGFPHEGSGPGRTLPGHRRRDRRHQLLRDADGGGMSGRIR